MYTNCLQMLLYSRCSDASIFQYTICLRYWCHSVQHWSRDFFPQSRRCCLLWAERRSVACIATGCNWARSLWCCVSATLEPRCGWRSLGRRASNILGVERCVAKDSYAWQRIVVLQQCTCNHFNWHCSWYGVKLLWIRDACELALSFHSLLSTIVLQVANCQRNTSCNVRPLKWNRVERHAMEIYGIQSESCGMLFNIVPYSRGDADTCQVYGNSTAVFACIIL